MGAYDLKVRTRDYALAIVQFYSSLPKTTEAQVLGKQVLRAGTSVGAQYREARRAKSNPDFISKVEGSLQELEEVGYWLELLAGCNMGSKDAINRLNIETEELIAILVTIINKVKRAP